MSVRAAFHQFEGRAEYFADGRCVVTDNGQATATFRTVERERPNNLVAIRTHGSQ